MNREIRRRHLFDFSKTKSNYKNKFFHILFFAQDEDIEKIIKTITRNQRMKNKLEKIILPQITRELGLNRFVINPEMDINCILKYYKCIFDIYSEKIEKYVQLKNKYESSFFSGKLKETLDILDEIENEIGFSIWGISKKMYLLDRVEGLEKHKKYLSDLQNEAGSNILLRLILDQESYFAESNTSYIAYKKRMSYNNDVFDDAVIQKYLDFKFNVERIETKETIILALMMDAQFSLIDMYETYVLGMQLLFVSEEMTPCYISSDFRLKNMESINCQNEMPSSRNEYYELLELYTKGEYKAFIDKSEKYLNKYPQDLQCAFLLIKASFNVQKVIDTIESNRLYKNIYNVYSLNKDDTDSLNELLALSKDVRATSWEYKIIGFIARKTSMKYREKWSFISGIIDMNLSPNLVCNNWFKNNKIMYLNTFADRCQATRNLYLFKLGCNEFPETITDKNRETLFKVDRFIIDRNFDDAGELLAQIKRNDDYYRERILRRYILINEGINDYMPIVKSVTEAILDNNSIQKRIDINHLMQKIQKNLTPEIKKSIYYVVLTYLFKPTDIGQQRIAYANFIEGNNYNSIDEIIKGEKNNEALIEFLYKVCDIRLIKRDIILNPGGKQTEEVRIEFLNKLIEIDSENKKRYVSEIASIMKQKSIKEKIKQINQSRVFVDKDNIKKDNETVFREGFDRYLLMKDFDDEYVSFDIYNEDVINDLRKIVDDMNEKIKSDVIYSQKIVVLKGIISNITEEFLFNEKYGLNTFLSSRIRHGYCKKQLTTVFIDNNLLSMKEKNKSEEYLINEYWDDVLPDSQEGQQIKKYLSEFTANIENKVDEIKKDWLSIKYKDESDSILDYSHVVNNALIIDRDNFIDFESFYNEIVDFLWGHTLKLFEKLRNKIQKELLEYFQKQLDNLYSNVSKITNNEVNKQIQTLCNNITVCKSQISGTIKEFANVFNKQDVSYVDFTMNDLVDACLEISLKLNPHFSDIKINKDITNNDVFKGEKFPYLVDVVSILLDNAVEHSGINSASDMYITIEVSNYNDPVIISYVKEELEKKNIHISDTNFVKLTVANRLGESIDTPNLEKKIADILSKMKDTDTVKKYSQSEGGTGLYKLYKTVQYNLNTAYSILYQVSEDLFEITILFRITDIIVKE